MACSLFSVLLTPFEPNGTTIGSYVSDAQLVNETDTAGTPAAFAQSTNLAISFVIPGYRQGCMLRPQNYRDRRRPDTGGGPECA